MEIQQQITLQNYCPHMFSDRWGAVCGGVVLTVTGPQGLTMNYDANGNITGKSDLGTANQYIYDNSARPYQLTGIETNTNLVPVTLQQITYTSFEQPSVITESPCQGTFKYNTEGQRVQMAVTHSGIAILTRWYAGSRYMKEKVGTTETHYTWLGGDAYSAPILSVKVNTGTPVIYYILRDHLGSITHVVKASDLTYKEYSFDAWGRRRSANDWNYTLDAGDHPLFAGRGFTGHEHLPEFNLINMNGRLYDPVLGRFLSPDNYIQIPDNTQNFNRDTYALNNPLVYTDPDGEWFFSLLFPPAAPVLIFVDAFLWGATIDYTSQVVDNISIQKSMGQKINWGDALWNQIDFVDAGVSGLTDAATLGIGKITKLPKYAKVGLKAATIFGSNTVKAHVDYEPGTGWNTSKSRDEINAELWASNLTSLTLGKTYDFGIDRLLPKEIVGNMLSDKFSERLQNFAVKTFVSPALNNWNRAIYNDVMRGNNYYYNKELQRWEKQNYYEPWWEKFNYEEKWWEQY